MEQEPKPPTEETEPAFEPPAPVDGGRLGTAVTIAVFVLFGLLLLATWSGRYVRAPLAVHAGVVTLLPYLYGLFILVVFGLWSLLPDRAPLPALLATAVAVAGALWGPTLPAHSEVAEGTPLRVMSWNVRRLWGAEGDGGNPQQCVEQVVLGVDPDVLTLLEVSADDVAALSPVLGLDCVHTDYLGNGSPTAGGLAVCVRGGTWSLVGGRPLRYSDDSDWRYVFSEVAAEGRVVNVIAVHLHPYYPWSDQTLWDLGERGQRVARAQADQSAALLERVSKFQDPSVVAGDFNSTRDATLHASLRKHLVDTWERGGAGFGGTVSLFGWVPLRIDYIYATDAFAVAGSTGPETGCSDHGPVVSDLVLRD